MRIILMGPPGVGKGTEAELLVKHYDIPHISTGNIFRELYKDKTQVGKIAKEYIDRGELVPDDITNEIVRHRLLMKDCKKGFLFDGYPRNIEQAKAFDALLVEQGWKLDAVINIAAPDHVIVDRIAGRRVCSTCGAVYHITNKKPKVEGICDVDGGKLIQRADDMEETVKRRLRIYYNQTEPVIGYYKAKGSIVEIDGTQTIEYTDTTIKKVLGEMN
ncbi:MAG TPA: adenylate kinase [Acholeplasmataceae bacterium]|nr:adenylate kinase [Acholeplasmataceae bacterium]HRX44514.1 adenylate kinase [Acholeplasmataceae bacterium]